MTRAAVLSVAFSLFSCGQPLTESECGLLLDRYTDKVIDQARPSTKSAERSELQRKAREKARLDPEFAECSGRVDRKQFACAMDAFTADQMERCLM